MGQSNSSRKMHDDSIKVSRYVRNYRCKNKSNCYNDNGKFISRRQMRKMAWKSIYGTHDKNTVVHSNVERHFRKTNRHKILR